MMGREKETHKHIWGCLGREREEGNGKRHIQYTTFTTETDTDTERMLSHRNTKTHTEMHTDIQQHHNTLKKHKRRETGSWDKFKQQTRPENVSQNTVHTIRHG